MMSTIKRAMFAMGAATMLLGASAASATEREDSTCSSCNKDGLFSSLINLVAQCVKVDAIDDIDISKVYVVDVDDVLNSSDILSYNALLLQNVANINLLQANLEDITVIDEGVNLDVNDVLNDFNADIEDVVSADVLEDGILVIFKD